MRNPRQLLLRALLLDWLGQIVILTLLLRLPASIGIGVVERNLQGQGLWLMFVLLLYPSLGWLFGSYTVLRWRRLSLSVLLQRLVITSAATVLVVAVARWLINPGESVWLLHRRVQVLWMVALAVWATGVRLALRRGFLQSGSPRLLLLAAPEELDTVLRAWRRVPQRQRLLPVQAPELKQQLDRADESMLVALSPAVRSDPLLRPLLIDLEMRDPRLVCTMSLLSLFEQQQERLPPALLADTGLAYNTLPWATRFSVQAQLKRLADLALAAVLLLLTAPFLLVASLLIWLEDRGPVVYSQQRSGWLGRPFTVYKLRTMTVQPVDAPARWTEPGDQRITRVGHWLRRVRLDELPQLLNVLNGDMSLIGPRPERPELEHQLEQNIDHYRKRHWMRPGLSGWAQVCAPYAGSVEDSDLKLSYDLYYLKHFSTWLDLIILFRTVKTVLKAGGR